MGQLLIDWPILRFVEREQEQSGAIAKLVQGATVSLESKTWKAPGIISKEGGL
jgi:hypothetical protein